MEQIIDVRKTQENLREKIKAGGKGIFDGEPIFKMPFNNLFTIGETGGEKILLPTNPDSFKSVMEQISVDGQPVELFYKDKVVFDRKEIQYGPCPVCNGTTREPITDERRPFAKNYSGYDKETDTVGCGNCGGQYQWGKPSGQVRLRPDGSPCNHHYDGMNVGRCLTQYDCRHCGDSYKIDSGD